MACCFYYSSVSKLKESVKSFADYDNANNTNTKHHNTLTFFLTFEQRTRKSGRIFCTCISVINGMSSHDLHSEKTKMNGHSIYLLVRFVFLIRVFFCFHFIFIFLFFILFLVIILQVSL